MFNLDREVLQAIKDKPLLDIVDDGGDGLRGYVGVAPLWGHNGPASVETVPTPFARKIKPAVFVGYIAKRNGEATAALGRRSMHLPKQAANLPGFSCAPTYRCQHHP
jgi:hypothetical protein